MTFQLGNKVRTLKPLDCPPFKTSKGCHLADKGDVG